MHIMQVVPRFFPAIGGMEEHVLQISLELVKRGHDVVVVTSNDVDGKDYPLQTETVEGIRVHRSSLFMPKMFREMWIIPKILKIFLQLESDIVHVHGYRCISSFSAVCSAQIRDVPSVLTPHGIYPQRSFANRLAKSSFDHLFGHLLLAFCDKIIALSDNNRELLLEMGASRDKIVIVPNGVNIAEYMHLQPRRMTNKDMSHPGPMLLYVGRIDWNKRVQNVVESMPMILEHFPSAKFIIVGPDYRNYVSELVHVARRLKVEHAVCITGNITKERLLDYYSAADIFLLPSSYEGFGLSMLEAMSSRVPVIVSPSGGPGDILSHKKNAWLLEEGSAYEISEAVCELLTDSQLRETLVNNAFELVKRKYTWKSVVDELEKVYKETMIRKARCG